MTAPDGKERELLRELLRDLRPARSGTGQPPWPPGGADDRFDGLPDRGDGWWTDPDAGLFGWRRPTRTCCEQAVHAVDELLAAGIADAAPDSPAGTSVWDVIGLAARNAPAARSGPAPLGEDVCAALRLAVHGQASASVQREFARRGVGPAALLRSCGRRKPPHLLALAYLDGWAPVADGWAGTVLAATATASAVVRNGWQRGAFTAWPDAAAWHAAGYAALDAARAASLPVGHPERPCTDRLAVMGALQPA